MAQGYNEDISYYNGKIRHVSGVPGSLGWLGGQESRVFNVPAKRTEISSSVGTSITSKGLDIPVKPLSK